MTQIKKEIFSRAVRMTHQFGHLADRNDPFNSGTQTFDMPTPNLSKFGGGGGKSPQVTVQQYGQHNYRPDSSPICKPSGGYADANGRMPDPAEVFGRPVPVGTKRRLGPPRTDK